MKIRELKVGNAIKQSSYVFSYSDKGVTREILISARSNNNGEFRGQYFETAFHMALIKDPNQTFHSFALAYAPSNAELFGNATFLNSYASYLNEEKILNIETASKETISWIKEQYINEIRAW